MQDEMICKCCGKPKKKVVEAWEGHRYGLQALKPAVEPIIVAQLPYDGKPVENMVRTGAGALNVDGGRIEYTGKTDPRTFGGEWRTDKAAKNVYEGGYVGEPQTVSAKGRWPSNFILDEATAPRLDYATVVDKLDYFTYNIERMFEGDIICGNTLESPKADGLLNGEIKEVEKYILSVGQFMFGNLSMEMFQTDLMSITLMGIKQMTELRILNLKNPMNTENCMEVLEQIIRLLTDMNSEGVRCAWNTKKLLSFIQEKQERLMDIARNVNLHICESGENRDQTTSQSICESGENQKSRFFYTVSSALDESDPVYYCAKVSNKERNAGLDDKNPHPTLKPLDLCKYLATLLLPPDAYAPRRILIPFSGSGSEMIGAGLAGWEQIVGVEFDTESGYVDIAKARLEHWLK